jgi:hypothetical protein
MVMFLLFVFSVIGLTNIMIDGSILAPLRAFLQSRLPASVYKIFECYQCMGTWCGFICGTILISHNPFVILTCGFAGSFLSVLAASYLNYIEARTIVNLGESDE